MVRRVFWVWGARRGGTRGPARGTRGEYKPGQHPPQPLDAVRGMGEEVGKKPLARAGTHSLSPHRPALPCNLPSSSNLVLSFSPHQIRFVLLISRQGKVRLAKWYLPLPMKEKAKV